jgi:hypothetical protein
MDDDGEVIGRSGWQIICPEENAQLGDTFRSSDEAFRLSAMHNSETGHNSRVVPCTNC